jgi:hypothetical protein
MKSWHGEHGQALTEFIVIALALVPLFLIVPLIGKYQDISHAAQMASRYVAFDATVNNDDIDGSSFKTADQLAGEVRRRFFSNVDAAIKTNDTAGNFDAHRNPLWSDTTGKALIADFDNDVCVTFGMPGGAFCSGATNGSGGYGGNGYGLTPFLSPVRSKFGLNERGVFTGAVHVRLANIPDLKPFDDINLVMTRHTSLVPNPWAASSVAKGEEAINNTVPTALLQPIQPLIDAVIFTAEAGQITSGPKLGDMTLQRDMVPSDRLCNYGAADCPVQQ